MTTDQLQVDAYEELGYAVFRDVIDESLLGEIRLHVEWLQKNRAASLSSSELFQFQRMNDDPFWHRVVSDDRLLDIACRFLGPDIALFGSGYFCKASSGGTPVLWHQDASYWPLEPMNALTLWLAIDESVVENGCMRVIPGSHRAGVSELIERLDVPNMLGSGMAQQHVDEEKAVNVILTPGDASVHHPKLVHGSLQNLSQRRRCGLAIRYIPTSTRIVFDGTLPGAFLLRGEDRLALNRYNQKPHFKADIHMPFKGMEAWSES